MILQLQIGPIAGTNKISDGLTPNLRGGLMGDLIVSKLQGDYFENTYRQKTFNGGIVGQVTSAALSTTYTGLCLSNPVGSGWLLVPTLVGYGFIVAPAAGMAIGLMTGYNSSTNVTHTAVVTPRNNYFGVGGNGVGLLDNSATLPTAPTINTIFDAMTAATITTSPKAPGGLIDLKGAIALPPGAYCCIYTSVASGAAGGHFSFTWNEIPLS